MVRRLRRHKKRPLQEVAQGGNVLHSPEYLTMCARGMKEHCKTTEYMAECIFARTGICDGSCTLWKNTPNFWPERRWTKK